jgi:hypothetical protein
LLGTKENLSLSDSFTRVAMLSAVHSPVVDA